MAKKRERERLCVTDKILLNFWPSHCLLFTFFFTLFPFLFSSFISFISESSLQFLSAPIIPGYCHDRHDFLLCLKCFFFYSVVDHLLPGSILDFNYSSDLKTKQNKILKLFLVIFL